MDRASFIEKYSRFDTPDVAGRIADEINRYIERYGIECLPLREIHGRHTGYLDISSGGFRNDYDFLCHVLSLCRVDRSGVVSADMRKIEKHLADWRASLDSITDEELEDMADSDFMDDDNLHTFRNDAYKNELDYFMNLDFPTDEEIIAHDEAVGQIWDLSSADGLESIFGEIFDGSDLTDGLENRSDSTLQREYDGDPSFAEFVSKIRRGDFGPLPEDYDGLAYPGDPGYYGDWE